MSKMTAADWLDRAECYELSASTSEHMRDDAAARRESFAKQEEICAKEVEEFSAIAKFCRRQAAEAENGGRK